MRTPEDIKRQDARDRARRDLVLRTQRLLGTSADLTPIPTSPWGSSLLQIRVEQGQRTSALKLR